MLVDGKIMIIQDQNKRNRVHMFKNRRTAGHELLDYLKDFSIDLILAIPNGGVPVIEPMLDKIHAEFNLLLIRKIQIPWNTEAGFGAVTPDGQVFFNEQLMDRIALQKKQAHQQVEAAKQKIKKRQKKYDLPSYEIQDKTVVLVDDGIASGFTMIAGANWLKEKRAKKIIIAVPTAPQGSLDKVKTLADTIICLNVRTRHPFAVANAYESWYDVPSDEVQRILKKIKRD